jgi:peptide/nickel transport system permease protein
MESRIERRAAVVATGSRESGKRAHPVGRFLVSRTVAAIGTLLVVSLIIFAATNLLPGNVAEVVLGKNATPANVAQLEGRLDLDHSFPVRYVHWLGGLVHGDLGESAAAVAEHSPETSVSARIGQPLLDTAVLATIAALLLIPLAGFLGVVAAINAGRTVDHGTSLGVLILSALPEFVFGTVLILIFFRGLDVVSPVALVGPGESPLAHPDHLVLPVATLLGVGVGFAARQIRAGMVESLGRDYVTMARLNGLPERRVLWRYAFRNALAPSVQAIAQTIQYLIGGIIVVESLFAYPGIGSLLVGAVATRDVTLVAGIAIILAAIYIAINIVADLLVVFLVPKLRTAL